MKIAVLGSAGSLAKAPFQNAQFRAWQENKAQSIMRAHDQIDGEFDVWGCSPGCWAVAPRATRWFEIHRWELNVPWFSPEYVQFLRDFKGPVYTGGAVPEIANHVVFPLDYIEEKFSSYFLTSSLALMLAMAIDTVEKIRRARESHRDLMREVAMVQHRVANGLPEPTEIGMRLHHELPEGIDKAELTKDDSDDVIGLWGVDMAATEEYAYQRPGCQFFVLEATRRGIGVYLPPESDLMRPMPVYGISEWDHSYIKLTQRSRELNAIATNMAAQLQEATLKQAGVQGEMHALNYMVTTWTSPYGMQHGLVNRQVPGTGLGSGITFYDGRPVTRMTLGERPVAPIIQAMSAPAPAPDPEVEAIKRVLHGQSLIPARVGEQESALTALNRIIQERDAALAPKPRRKHAPAKPAKRKR